MKCKSNILLITLFLLMMSSLSALLITTYIKNLIRLSGSFHEYYQSYYIANAGLELALVKTNGQVRGYGFEDKVESTSDTVTRNLICTNCSFTTTIKTSSTVLGEENTTVIDNPSCETLDINTQRYEIPPGGCVPIILLQDNSSIPGVYVGGEGKLINISDTNLKEISSPIINVYGTRGFTSLITKVKNEGDSIIFDKGRSTGFVTNADGVYSHVIFNTDPSPSGPQSNDKLILMIANTDAINTGYYCLHSNVSLPTQYVTIDAQGTYGRTSLNLKGIRKAGLPGDFCYTAISANQ